MRQTFDRKGTAHSAPAEDLSRKLVGLCVFAVECLTNRRVLLTFLVVLAVERLTDG